MNWLLCFYCILAQITAKTLQFTGTPNNPDFAQENTNLLNKLLNSLKPGDELIIPAQVYPVIGGIVAHNLKGVKIVIDGTLSFTSKRKEWPKDKDGGVAECIVFTNLVDSVITSNSRGVLDGNGHDWWGFINYALFQEDRPRLLRIIKSRNVVVENLLLKDSPFWSFWATDSDGLIVRFVDVYAKRTDKKGRTLWDLGAFNTDGIDVTGRNVHIHDCNIECQDDCVAVKDNSRDMLIERITCSGLGLVVGSIGASVVQNITFRDSVLPNTFKGKFC
jgi:polygalacturonase